MSLKISLPKALELLKALGAPVAEIVTDEAQADKDVNTDTVLSAVDKSRAPIIRSQIEAEVKDTVSKAATGKIAGTFKSALARAAAAAGVTRSELDGFEPGKEEDMIANVLSKYSAFAGKDTEALRTQLTDMGNKQTAELKKVREDYEGKLAAEQAKFVGRDIEESLAAIVTKIPRIGGDPVAQAKLLKSELEQKYHLHYNADKKTVELRDKTDNAKAILNEAGTTLVPVADVAKTYLSSLGLVATDNRNVNPQGAMQTAQQNQHMQVGNQQQYNQQVPTLDPVAAANLQMMAELGSGEQ